MNYISNKFKEDYPEHFSGKVFSDTVQDRIFYQYQKLENEYVKTIKEQCVYVSDPSKFRDPYDCWGILLSDIKNYNAEKLIHAEQKLRRGVQQLGVICLTSSWDNQLMWSHYADSHAGMCLGFKVIDLIQNDGENFFLLPVQYADITPIPISEAWHDEETNLASKATSISFLRTKIPDWHYEREWRFLCSPKHRGKKRNLSNFGLELKEIIFGQYVPLDKREDTINSLTTAKINIDYYKIEFDRKLLSLSKVPIV